jgi:glutaredoxin
VQASARKFDEMIARSGGTTTVPVIVDGDKVTIGFTGNMAGRGGIPMAGVG